MRNAAMNTELHLDDILREVDSMKSSLAKSGPFPKAVVKGPLMQLRETFVSAFTYNSNAIEGNTLNYGETNLVLYQGIVIPNKPIKDHLEIVGHRNAIEYVERFIRSGVPLTTETILSIHDHVLMDRPFDRGAFRSVGVRLLGHARTFPPPDLVPQKIEELLVSHRESTLHPIVEAARFHLEFEGVHPFVDGNGRTGRLLLNMMLQQSGYTPITIEFKRKRDYFDCFDAYERNGDITPLSKMVGRYVIGVFKSITDICDDSALLIEEHKADCVEANWLYENPVDPANFVHIGASLS